MQFLFMLAFRIYFLTFTYNIIVNVSHFVNVICKKELLEKATPFLYITFTKCDTSTIILYVNVKKYIQKGCINKNCINV